MRRTSFASVLAVLLLVSSLPAQGRSGKTVAPATATCLDCVVLHQKVTVLSDAQILALPSTAVGIRPTR